LGVGRHPYILELDTIAAGVHCKSYDTVTVVVDNIPALSPIIIIGGENPTCTGNTVTLYTSKMSGDIDSVVWKVTGNPISGSTVIGGSSYIYTIPIGSTSGRYTATAYMGKCKCEASVDTFITIVPPTTKPIIVADKPITNKTIRYCEGESVTLDERIGSIYQWYLNTVDASGEIAGAVSYQYKVNKPAGTYLYILGMANMAAGQYCWNYDSVTVVVQSLPELKPIIFARGTPYFCSGESIVLQADVNNYDSIRWQRGNPLTTVGSGNTYTISDNTDGLYRVVAYKAGCPVYADTQTYIRNAPAKPVIKRTDNTAITNKEISICTSDSVMIEDGISRMAPYQWYRNGGILPADTLYKYTVKIQGGAAQYILGAATFVEGRLRADYCWSYDTLNVIAKATPVVDIITLNRGQNAICRVGDSVQLTAQTVSTGISGYRWTHYDGSSLTLLADNTASIRASAGGTYSVSAIGSNGCNSVALDKEIEARDMPKVPYIWATAPVCDGGSGTLYVTNTYPNEDYRWCYASDSSPIYTDAATSSSYTIHNNTKYLVLASIRYTDGLACYTYGPADSITIYPVPMTPIVINRKGTSDSSCIGDTIEFLARPPADNYAPINSWLWYNVFNTDTALFPYQEDSILPINWRGEGEYTVRAFTREGCVSPRSIPRHVIIDPPIDPILRPKSHLLCAGDDAVLQCPTVWPGYDYSWYKNGALIYGANEPFYEVTSANTVTDDYADEYNFVVSISRCPNPFVSDTATVAVKRLPSLPVVNRGRDTALCLGSDITMNVASTGAVRFMWYKNERLHTTIEGVSTFPITSLQLSDAGQYSVESMNGWGCRSIRRGNSVWLDVLRLPDITFTQNTACSNETRFDFVEPRGGTFSCTKGCEDPSIFNPSKADGDAVLSYSYTNSAGCSNYQEEFVRLIEQPAVPVIRSFYPLIVCREDTFAIELNGISKPQYSFQWFKNNYIIPYATDINYYANSIGEYTLQVRNERCYADSMSNTLHIVNFPVSAPPVLAAENGNYFCPDGSKYLFVQDGPVNNPYQWTKEDNRVVVPIPDVTTHNNLTVFETGDYYTRYVDDNNCLSAYSNRVSLLHYPRPYPPVIYSTATNYYFGLNYRLSLYQPVRDERYEWYKNGASLDLTGTEYIIRNLANNDIARYAVNAINEYGCSSMSDEYSITSAEHRFLIPNVFTPNGDGINDYFEILGLENFIENKLEIVSKKGVVIYSTNNYGNDWDGAGYPTDIYYYILTLKDLKGYTQTHKGFFHIKRDR
jgi:gliding motility-associated-like protein